MLSGSCGVLLVGRLANGANSTAPADGSIAWCGCFDGAIDAFDGSSGRSRPTRSKQIRVSVALPLIAKFVSRKWIETERRRLQS